MNYMRKVLITGAGGFIGKAVLKELVCEKDVEIYATTTNKAKMEKFLNENGIYHKVNICEIDLLNQKDTAKLVDKIRPEYLIHLAWSLEGNNKFQDSLMNIDWMCASINLIKEVCLCGGKRILFAGSSSQYEFSPESLVENENMRPLNLYGKCKKEVEEVAMYLCEQMEVSFASARYFSVYGPYDERAARAIPSAIEKLLAGERIVCKEPYNKWDYIYIDDAAKATIKLLNSKMCGAVNIASGEGIRMKDVFEIIARNLGKEDLLELDEHNKSRKCLVADSEKMKEILDYRCETGFEEGMRYTIKWWQDKMK